VLLSQISRLYQGESVLFSCSTLLECQYKKFMFLPGQSNLSHNHQLVPQSTVVDGRTIVTMESPLFPEECYSIKGQSQCQVHIPQMCVNLEEYFPDQSFSSSKLHRMRLQFMKEKYGADGHNFQDLFMKRGRLQHLGGLFIVVPYVTDFSIETTHCQTKLMGRVCKNMVKMVSRWLMGLTRLQRMIRPLCFRWSLTVC
jgi:hypothetical protein